MLKSNLSLVKTMLQQLAKSPQAKWQNIHDQRYSRVHCMF